MKKNLLQLVLIVLGSTLAHAKTSEKTTPFFPNAFFAPSFFAPQFAAPVLTAPSNAATGIDVAGVALSWNLAPGSVNYKVELADNINFFNANTWPTSMTSITTASLKQGVTYYWRVTSLSASGVSQGVSAVWSFTTATLSGVPTLSAPANSTTSVTAMGIDLQWATVATATKYTVQWADNPQFINTADSTIAGTLLNTGVLQRTTKYFWRVRAENEGGEAPTWSAVRTFTTIGLPNAPVLNSPADGATGQAVTSMTLRWNAVIGANTYTVQYADNPDFVNFKSQPAYNNFTTINITLPANTTFYWRVFAGNNQENLTSPISPARSFTTAAATTSPTLASPPDGFAGISSANGAVLQWSALSGAATVGAYKVEWADNPNFLYPSAGVTSAVNYNTSITGALDANKTYYWRITGTYSTGGTIEYPTRTFSTAAANTQPILTAPLNKANAISTSTVNLAWAALASANDYTVEIADNPLYNSAITLNSVAPNVDFTTLNANTNYYWRAKANTATGSTPWSATWAFSTAAIAAQTTLTAPTNNAQNVALSGVALTWQAVANAADYEVMWSPNQSFSSDVNKFTTSNTSFNAVGFTISTNYYWRVRARNSAGNGAWSPVYKFATLMLPTAATLTTPANNGTNASVVTANLAWQSLPLATSYDLQVTANNNFTSDIRNFSVSATTKTVDTFAQNLNHYWRIRGRNGLVVSPWSAVWTFKTAQLATAPSLATPANSTLNISHLGTTVSWNVLPNATFYEIQYAPTPVFSAGVGTQIVTATNTTTTALIPNYTYYWRVRGGNAGGVSPWSSTFAFTVEEVTAVAINATLSTTCANQSTSLTASGGVSYNWNNNSISGATITVAPSQTTTYIVTITKANGTTTTLAQTINVNALPTPSITGNLTFCPNGSTTLTAIGGASYLWSNADNTAITQITEADTYTVTVTSASGCTANTTITVSELAAPPVTITAPAGFCVGSTASLTASGGTSFVWNTGAISPIIQITNSGTYTVVATGANSCTANTSVSLIFYALPTPSITAPIGFCTGSTATLTASGGANYAWSNNVNAPITQITVGGTYNVVATASNGCTASTAITVAEYALPVLQVSAPTGFCEGTRTVVIVIGGTNYAWSDPSFGNIPNPTISLAGTYTVTVTNTNNCSAITAMTLVEFALPALPTTTQNGNTITTNATDNLQWFVGNTLLINENGSTVQATQSGDYVVCTTNQNGCQSCSLPLGITVATQEDHSIFAAVSVYPNPTQNDITIENLPLKDYEIRVFDATGKLFQTYKGNSLSQNISLSDLAEGIYHIVISSDDDVKQFNVSKIR
jgi:Secretion system C-terminal sorting domain